MKYKYAFIRSLVGSGNSSVSKMVMMFLPVYPVLFTRYFGGFLLNFLKKEQRGYVREDLKKLKNEKKVMLLFVISLMMTAINIWVFYYILNTMPLTISNVMINGAYVVFSVLLGRFVLGEKKSKRVYLYIMMVVLGLMLYVLMGSNQNVEVSWIAIALMLFNAIGSSVETVLSAINIKTLKNETVIAAKMFTGAMVGIVFVLITKQSFSEMFSEMTIWLFGGLMFLTLSGFLVKVLEYKSMKVIGAAETAVFGILTFVLGTMISMVVFEEWLNIYQYVALIVIVAALYMIQRDD